MIDITPAVLEAITADKKVQDAIKDIGGGASIKDLVADRMFRDKVVDIIKTDDIEPSKDFCEAVLNYVADKFGDKIDVNAIASQLFDLITALPEPKKMKAVASAKRAGTKAKTRSSKNPIVAFLFKYCRPGQTREEGKQNTVIKGGSGSGKTYSAMQFAKTAGFDKVIFMQCMDGMEARDVVGGPTVDGEGNLVYCAGPLTHAWSLAEKGQTVCLVVDEYGSLPLKSRQSFQSAVIPNEDGMLELDTGEPYKDEDGIIRTRRILAPMANISIICTTNVGPAYGVAPDTPALRVRFKPFYAKNSPSLVTAVVGDLVKSRGWTDKITNAFVTLWKGGEDANKKHLLEFAPTVREFVHAINCVQETNESKAYVALRKELLSPGFNSWFVAEDHEGEPMKDQVQAWEKLVEKAFAA